MTQTRKLAKREWQDYFDRVARGLGTREVQIEVAALKLAFERTCAIIRARTDQLDRAARQLLAQETMDEAELRGFFDIREKKTATGEARRRLSRDREAVQ
jgi:hypothetical protein